MNKRLFLHIINNGEEVARKELLSYTYGAKRMGGAPTLTSTLQDLNILDINNKCWAMFADEDGVESGEVYYVKQVPNSTKSNTDARYKYDIEFIHERFVLDNIYLFDVDATLGSGSAEEKVSNKTEFIWSGNLYNYLIKLDAALEYSFKNAPSGYERYRVDFSGANRNDTKEVVISFKDVTFTAALQEIYNKFEVPYYFEGKTIYIGDQISSVVTTPLEYGANDALLSISKQNANHKTVNRCTGVGSSDNLPYYYPNDSATGEHEVTTTNGIVVDSINYDILGLYADLAQETYLKLSSRYDKDYSTDTTYKSVLNIDLPNRKPYVEGSLKTFDGSEGFKNQSATYAKSRSIEHFAINRPSDVAFGNSFNEDGYVVHDYNYNSSSGGGGSSSTPTIPLGYLHKSVYSTALVTKSVYLAAESKADGLLHVEDISTVFNAYAKESTTISYQCNLKGYDLDSAGESFNVSKITSIYVKIYKGDVLVKTYTPTNLTGTFDVSFTPTSDGHYKAVIIITCSIDGNANEGNIYPISSELTIKRVVPSGAREYLLQLGRKNEDGEIIYDEKNYDLTTLGIYLGDSEATEGEIIISEGRNRMPNQKNLMPSIYRDTYGAERFYEATNGDYKVQYTDEWRDDNPQEYIYTFERSDDWDGFANPFEGEVHLRREHVISVEDIKPTIKEARYKGTRIDTLVDVAFDRDDNNDFDENEELKHGYFFVKLPPLGFNLFSMASEQGEMTISMTSGDCNSCSFVIGVGEKTKRNIVEVDGSGNLLRDENGNVKIGEDLEVQNDTTNNSVWLALKKDKSTFGVWMPDSKNHAMPKAGDTYVLLNIRLPKVYIMEAEKRLENEIVKFLKDNNDEKFNFSVKLSRIFFAKEENREVLESLNENSIVSLNYFGKNYSGLYVSSYQVRKSETDVLPEISISLTDSLAPNSAPLQHVVNQVKAEVMSSVTNVDFVSQAARTFIRKDKDDTTAHKISAQNIEVSDNITSSGPIKTYSNLDVTGYAKLLKGVHTDGDVTVGNYREVLGNISGAKISKEGNASFNAIKANVMEIGSLSYNQVRATSAYTMFDDTATIVAIDYVVGGYILTLEGETKDDNGEFVQPFDEGDIVFGVVNKMNNLSNAQKGECWMNVVEVIGNNKIKTILYSGEQTSDGINLQPTIDMLIAHRGNNHKNSNGEYDKVERQSSFYISSKDGNIVQLLGVTSPLLYKIDEEAPDGSHYSNYGVVLGKPTEDLYNYIKERYPYVKSYDPIMFAKYGIFENFLQLDHKGSPIKTANFRGEWSLDTATNDPYRVTFTTYDTVTHDGSLWECRLDGTNVEPTNNTTEWLLLVSKGEDKPMPNENLLDNTLRYDDNWQIENLAINKAVVEDGEDGRKVIHCTGRSNNKPFAKQFITGESVDGGVNKVVAGEWYTLSFELKGTSGGVRNVLSDGIANESEVIYIDGVEQSYTDNMNVAATEKWVLHSYTFKTALTIPAAFVGLTVTGVSDFYLDKIKLERGKEVTPWTTSVNDGIGKQGADGEKGDKGDKGDTGPAGERGALLSHQGNYDPKEFYTLNRNDDGSIFSIPCVYLPAEKGNGSYLTLKKDMEYSTTIDGVLYPYNPNTLQPIGPDDSEYWAITPYQEQVFTKFLMANYAQFGSNKGAVFFDRFLFSQYGVDRNGRFGHYLDYEDVMWDEDGSLSGEFTPSLAIDMYSGWVRTNKLSETYQEFKYSDDNGIRYAMEIKQEQSYNIKITPSSDGDNRLISLPLTHNIMYEDSLVIPSQPWEPEGMRCSILVRPNRQWERSMRNTINGATGYGYDHFDSLAQASAPCVLVCADSRWINPYAWQGSIVDGSVVMINGGNVADNDVITAQQGTIYEKGYFCVGGTFTNFILIEPGFTLQLRSMRDEFGNVYWYVENPEAFDDFDFTVGYELNHMLVDGEILDTDHSSFGTMFNSKYQDIGGEATGNYGYKRRTCASKSLIKLRDKFLEDTGDSSKCQVSFGIHTTEDISYYSGEAKAFDWSDVVVGISCHDKYNKYE